MSDRERYRIQTKLVQFFSATKRLSEQPWWKYTGEKKSKFKELWRRGNIKLLACLLILLAYIQREKTVQKRAYFVIWNHLYRSQYGQSISIRFILFKMCCLFLYTFVIKWTLCLWVTRYLESLAALQVRAKWQFLYDDLICINSDCFRKNMSAS